LDCGSLLPLFAGSLLPSNANQRPFTKPLPRLRSLNLDPAFFHTRRQQAAAVQSAARN
jgi:hypothetical protein